MMPMHIEKATLADIPALSELLSILFAQEAEFIPNPEAQQRGLALIIGNAEMGTVWVAKQDQCIVGMVNILFTVSTALGERVAVLEDMVITPAQRGQGVGTALLSAAVAWAGIQGCKRITLLTDRTNSAAQRFYGKQGFTASSMLAMRLPLP